MLDFGCLRFWTLDKRKEKKELMKSDRHNTQGALRRHIFLQDNTVASLLLGWLKMKETEREGNSHGFWLPHQKVPLKRRTFSGTQNPYKVYIHTQSLGDSQSRFRREESPSVKARRIRHPKNAQTVPAPLRSKLV